jgi:methylated-DNA-[protein]-cysteine S-methyltransferase
MKISSVNFEFPCFGLCVEHNDQELIRAYFYNSRLDSRPVIVGDASALSLEIINQLQAYLKNSKFKFNLPYKLLGTQHQLKVWQIMEGLQVGNCITYGEVAKLIKSAPRAIGGACGKNPFPVIVPCHRIIAANNSLGGFNSGNLFFSLGIKRWLLEHEGLQLN